jgi:tRNA(Ile)-lysidine synthetase-like protein
MKKYIIAVSGGVDSVVLLDMLVSKKLPTPSTALRAFGNPQLIVAHFDHGIRADSARDAIFVADLAKKYGLPFETKREELGPNASEDMARARRYKFLRAVAKKHNAQLVTAHHADDVIETIAINLSRGTGWRGSAVLDSDILRPLTGMTKLEIISYANQHKLTWNEDSTNAGTKYLRNRIRQKTADLDDDSKRQLLGLWAEQKSSKKLIDKEVARLVGEGPTYDRYFFIHIDSATGMECLRHIVGARLTRPQLMKTLHAIKTALPRKTFLAGNGVEINFTSRNFTVKLIK